ncbi:MAG: lipopolysaccharide heptosyltransferase II [Gemmatimonadales bacterium]|nr:lipopolysaccharide heptosyltransferase II [Gemmatimonadales bacterium]
MPLFSRPRSGAVVVQTAYMGDVILTTPLLTALAAIHGPVDVVVTPQSAPLLDGHPAVRQAIRYDKRGADRGWAGLRRIASQLRRLRHAQAYLPHRSRRSAMLVFLARVPERIGFEDSAAASFYTRRLPRPVQSHEAARLASLALAPGAPVPPVSLGITDADRAEADAWLVQHDVRGPFVALGPGSPWAAKRWPWFAELALRSPLPSVLIGGATDAALGLAIEAAAPGRVANACGQVGPRTSAALIARAAALVTNDSSPLHLGLATGTPIVALFGPTVPSAGFGPIDPRDESLGLAELLCRPCASFGPAACPLEHHRCMRELHVGQVVAALERALARGGASPA